MANRRAEAEYGTQKRRATAEDVEIGRKIRALRLERGLSQSDLASVSAGRLQRIANLLNAPVTRHKERPG